MRCSVCLEAPDPEDPVASLDWEEHDAPAVAVCLLPGFDGDGEDEIPEFPLCAECLADPGMGAVVLRYLPADIPS